MVIKKVMKCEKRFEHCVLWCEKCERCDDVKMLEA